MRARMAATWGAIFGASATTTASTLPIGQAAARRRDLARASGETSRCRRPSTPGRSAGSGRRSSPARRRRGPRRSARGAARPRPSGPRGRRRAQMATPPRRNGRPGANGCASKPIPTLGGMLVSSLPGPRAEDRLRELQVRRRRDLETPGARPAPPRPGSPDPRTARPRRSRRGPSRGPGAGSPRETPGASRPRRAATGRAFARRGRPRRRLIVSTTGIAAMAAPRLVGGVDDRGGSRRRSRAAAPRRGPRRGPRPRRDKRRKARPHRARARLAAGHDQRRRPRPPGETPRGGRAGAVTTVRAKPAGASDSSVQERSGRPASETSALGSSRPRRVPLPGGDDDQEAVAISAGDSSPALRTVRR